MSYFWGVVTGLAISVIVAIVAAFFVDEIQVEIDRG